MKRDILSHVTDQLEDEIGTGRRNQLAYLAYNLLVDSDGVRSWKRDPRGEAPVVPSLDKYLNRRYSSDTGARLADATSTHEKGLIVLGVAAGAATIGGLAWLAKKLFTPALTAQAPHGKNIKAEIVPGNGQEPAGGRLALVFPDNESGNLAMKLWYKARSEKDPEAALNVSYTDDPISTGLSNEPGLAGYVGEGA